MQEPGAARKTASTVRNQSADTGLKEEGIDPAGSGCARPARRARESGAERFCMGAAWRRPKDRQLDQVIDMLKVVREEGLENLPDPGHVDPRRQAQRLKDAGLDYYNHNLDTSPEYYEEIISTRTYDDRLETLQAVRESGIEGSAAAPIIGMGESRTDRVGLIAGPGQSARAYRSRYRSNQAGQVLGHAAGWYRADRGRWSSSAPLQWPRIVLPAITRSPVGWPRSDER